MKQITKKTVSGLMVAVMLTLVSVGSLTACSDGMRLKTMKESDRAVEFIKILNRNMDSQSSYVTEMETSMTMELYRREISMVATATDTVCGQGTDDYFTHSETHQTMTMDGDETEMTTIEGFADGKMFYYYAEEGERTVKLWSALSSEEYVAFDKAYGLVTDIDDDVMAAEAATRTCVQNTDKTWTATYTDYTSDGLKAYESILGDLESMLENVRVADMVMTVNASEELLPTTMEMEFVFEPTEETDEDVALPKMTAQATYKEIGTAEAFVVELDKYNEVDDLRVVTMMEKSLRDFLAADKAEFKVVTAQRAEYKGQSSGTTETDRGSFEVGENGYTFEIEAGTNGAKYDITYEDGMYLMMQGDVRKAKRFWSETEAKDYIKKLLDPASFTASQVRRIEKDEEASDEDTTVYLVTIKTPDLSQYESALGGVDLSGVTTVKVTMEGGRMIEQHYKIDMSSSYGHEYIVSAICTYISMGEGTDSTAQTEAE